MEAHILLMVPLDFLSFTDALLVRLRAAHQQARGLPFGWRY
jgi:hypothetical protein